MNPRTFQSPSDSIPSSPSIKSGNPWCFLHMQGSSFSFWFLASFSKSLSQSIPSFVRLTHWPLAVGSCRCRIFRLAVGSSRCRPGHPGTHRAWARTRDNPEAAQNHRPNTTTTRSTNPTLTSHWSRPRRAASERTRSWCSAPNEACHGWGENRRFRSDQSMDGWASHSLTSLSLAIRDTV